MGRRNTNLDALRAIAVFMVLARHAGMTTAHMGPTSALSKYFTQIGWAGVDLFFVLSGFLVSGLLFSAYRQRQRLDVSRFYVRRGLKIWPAFYALIVTGLVFDAVIPGQHFSTKGLVPELLFVQDYFAGIWGITWSLAVEEHFYLLLPLVLLVMLRRAGKPGETPFAAMPYFFAAVAVFSLICRFGVGWNAGGNVSPLVWYFPTHLRMDALMFGVLLSYYRTFRPATFERVAAWRGGWMMIAAGAVLLSILPVEDRNMHTWGFTLIYLSAGFLIAKAVAHEGPAPIRKMSTLLARVGIYSYSIYLWQIFWLWRILPHLHIPGQTPLYWAFFVGAILFGIAAAKTIEIPVIHFRDRVFPPVPKTLLAAEASAASSK